REVEAASRERAGVAQELHKLDVDLSEARGRMGGLVQRTQEASQVDLGERYKDATWHGLPAHEAGAGQDEGEDTGRSPVPQESAPIDWDAIAKEIRELRERIQRLGNVNLDAIGELDELEKRQTDYATQVADLASSKEQLEALI